MSIRPVSVKCFEENQIHVKYSTNCAHRGLQLQCMKVKTINFNNKKWRLDQYDGKSIKTLLYKQ